MVKIGQTRRGILKLKSPWVRHYYQKLANASSCIQNQKSAARQFLHVPVFDCFGNLTMTPVNTEVGYRFIRDKILSGSYAPGQPLQTNALAKEIGISRTPVRDALRQLEADGLVTIRPRLGATVKSMDLQEFRDLCGLRQNLETYAAGLAALNRTEAELTEMRRALEAMRTITRQMLKTKNDREQAAVEAMDREDVRFHHNIVTASKNEFLKKEILRLHLVDRVVSVRPAKLKVDFGGLDIRRKSLKDHERIFDAIRERDVTAAEEAMRLSFQDIIDYSLRLKGIEDQSDFQNALGLATPAD